MNAFQRMLPLLGRVLFALIFLTAAPRHFTHEGISHAADLGVPLANLLVPLSGILAFAGGLSVATGFHARYGALALILGFQRLDPGNRRLLRDEVDERARERSLA